MNLIDLCVSHSHNSGLANKYDGTIRQKKVHLPPRSQLPD